MATEDHHHHRDDHETHEHLYDYHSVTDYIDAVPFVEGESFVRFSEPLRDDADDAHVAAEDGDSFGQTYRLLAYDGDMAVFSPAYADPSAIPQENAEHESTVRLHVSTLHRRWIECDAREVNRAFVSDVDSVTPPELASTAVDALETMLEAAKTDGAVDIDVSADEIPSLRDALSELRSES